VSHWDECEMCKKIDKPAVLHVDGQDHEHTDAHLVANTQGLLLLREAIDQALAGRFGKATVQAADGEGYTLNVMHHEIERMGRLQLPYAGWEARYDTPLVGRPPHSLVPATEGDPVVGDDEWDEFEKAFR